MPSMPKLPALPALGAGIGRAVALAVTGALVIGAGWFLFAGGSDGKMLTASFPRTVSVYEGSEVRVLGVPIGEVVTVEPSGTTVEVTMTYDEEVQVPANAKAVVIAPSVVGDRYVQLTPVYDGGPELEDGAKLDTSKTAVPLELDEIYQNLSDLAVALGPRGANSDGALSRLLRTQAENFGGQGKQFNRTIRNLSKFTATLDNNKEELFGTAREIERFVGALARNDQTVRDFNDSLASASSVLEGEREELAAALKNLGVAMGQVSRFVKENEQALSDNVKGLVRVTNILVKQRAALEETFSAAPTALSNLFHTYNPSAGTLDTRSNFGENIDSLERDPANTLCSLVTTADPNGELCQEFQDMFGNDGDGELPGGLGRASVGGKAAGNGAKQDAKHIGNKVVVIEPIDTTLAGIVEVAR